MSAISKLRPVLVIPCTKWSPEKVAKLMGTKGPLKKYEGGLIEAGPNAGKGYNAVFLEFAGKDDEFDAELLDIFDCLENGIPRQFTLPNGAFWHLCLSRYDHHQKVTEPEIHFGSF